MNAKEAAEEIIDWQWHRDDGDNLEQADIEPIIQQCIDDALKAEAADVVLTLKPTSRRIYTTHAADRSGESKGNEQADTKTV